MSGLLESALAEAVGGGTVASVVILAEWFRNWRSGQDRKKRARTAVEVELHRLDRALHSRNRPPPVVHIDAIVALVRVGMDRTGDPLNETDLAHLQAAIDEYNAAAVRLAGESTGASRAMGDHATVMASLEEQTANARMDVEAAVAALRKRL